MVAGAGRRGRPARDRRPAVAARADRHGGGGCPRRAGTVRHGPGSAPAPAPRQWTVIPDTSGYGGAVRPAAAVLAEWRRELLDERSHGLGDPVTAPISGTWWTTPPSGLLDTTTERDGRGPLGLWAVEDHTGWERAAVAPAAVDPSARIVVVDDAEDWAALCRAAPIDVTATTRRHDWYRATGRDGAWVVPDWAAIAERYDAVHLTLRGWLRASGTAIPVDADSADGTADSADGTRTRQRRHSAAAPRRASSPGGPPTRRSGCATPDPRSAPRRCGGGAAKTAAGCRPELSWTSYSRSDPG